MEDRLTRIVTEQLRWNPTSVSVEFEKTGLTNRNYVVKNGADKVVVRIAGPNTAELGIRREVEAQVLDVLATTRLAPYVIYYDATSGDMVTRYIEGKPMTNDDLKDITVRAAIAQAMRVYQGLSVQYTFEPYQDIEERIKTAVARGAFIPNGIDSFVETLQTVKATLESSPRYGLCHNDPWSNNFLISTADGQLRLLDWEYAGMGDVFFDFACICFPYGDEERAAFLCDYYGQAEEQSLHRLRCAEFVVCLWNLTWSMVQSTNVNTGCDYQKMTEGMASYMLGLAERLN